MQAQTLIGLGRVLQWRADFDRSLTCLHEGMELAHRAHAGFLFGMALFWSGVANAAKAAYEEALRRYRQLGDYATAAGDTYWLPRIPNITGGVHLLRDEHGHAGTYFRLAEALLEEDAWARWRWHIALLRA